MKTGNNPMYRMPVFFGPACGPRRTHDGGKHDGTKGFDAIAYSISFLSNADQLTELLPPKFELYGDPIVTLNAKYMKNIAWLGGRGYNLLGVTIPATFRGTRDVVTGTLLLVLWENMADPIVAGREELGYSKIYAELPEPMQVNDTVHCSAGWMGFKFLDLTVTGMRAPTDAENRAAAGYAANFAGNLHYKYVPRTGEWGKADIEQAILGPKSNPEQKTLQTWSAEGNFTFHKATWQELPTQFMVVNTLAELEMKQILGVRVTQTTGSKDLGDMRILV